VHGEGVVQAYILKRVLLNIPVLLIISVLVFSLMRLVPGDTVMAQIGATGNIPKDELQRVRKDLGLDRPFVVQYLVWLKDVAHGDFGRSLWTRGSTWGRLTNALPITAELATIAIVAGVALAIPIGVLSAVKQNTAVDYLGRLFAITWLSLPDFWIGTLVVILPALWWKYHAPIGFAPFTRDPATNLKQILPPAIILGLRLSSNTMRLTRSQMLEVLRQDYVRTARAKGLRERATIVRHTLKNALLPVSTVIGGQIAFLAGGTVVLETLFTLPGVGQLTFSSIGQRDYTQIQTNVMFLAVILLTVNLLTDLSYAWFDPRIRYG
jgi:peptide/nickel transport system permease protein